MRLLNRYGRAVAVIAMVAVAMAVGLTGCDGNGGADEGGNAGGSIPKNTCTSVGSCKSVTIGGVKWMSENLNIQTANSWCSGGNNSNCDKYGRLYTWEAARTACPPGWRLPDRMDWQDLVTFAGGAYLAGKRLKAKSGWSNNRNGTDNFGFSALPGGYRYSDGVFVDAGSGGFWWTATENGSGNAYSRDIVYDDGSVGEGSNNVDNAFSLRCVGD